MKRPSEEMDAEPAAAASRSDALPSAADTAKRVRTGPTAAVAKRVREEVCAQPEPWRNMFTLGEALQREPHLPAALRELGMCLVCPRLPVACVSQGPATADPELYERVRKGQMTVIRHALARLDSLTQPTKLEMVPLPSVVDALLESGYRLTASVTLSVSLPPRSPSD
jgi:hypothetical protein